MATRALPAKIALRGRKDRATGRPLSSRVFRRVAYAHILGGAAGAIDVALLLRFVLPEPTHPGVSDSTLILVNSVTLAIVLPLALVAGTTIGYRLSRPFKAFDDERHNPTEEERLAVIRHPLRSAAIDAGFWLAGAVLYAGINLQYSPDVAFHVGSTIVMGGATTTAVTYLLTERLMRPLTARALAAGPLPRPSGPGTKRRLVIVWLLATGVPVLGIVFTACHVLGEGGLSRDGLAVSVLILAGAAAAVGLHATVLVARSLAEPLVSMRAALARVEEGDLDVEVRVDDAGEVGLLQSGFNRMVAGLRERDRLRDLFGRHVGEEVARTALDRPVELGGERRRVAVLFVDLVGSTTLAERDAPEAVVGLLNRFFAIVVDTVSAHGGWVNKFEGDAALCVFGAPLERDDCVAAAMDTARTLHERLERELPEVAAGIGVSAGVAVAGNVGTEHRYEYTVIGQPVNEAARLCELAKRRPERVLASEAVLDHVDPERRRLWRLDEEVVLRGRSSPTRLAVPTAGAEAVAEAEPAPSG